MPAVNCKTEEGQLRWYGLVKGMEETSLMRRMCDARGSQKRLYNRQEKGKENKMKVQNENKWLPLPKLK